MANNIEVVLSGKDAGFTDTLTKAAATLSTKNTEMINSLGNTAKALGATGQASKEAGADVAASATKYSELSEAARNLAAGQVLIRQQIKETSQAIKDGSIDAIAGKAAILELNAATRALGTQYAMAARNVANGAGEITAGSSRTRAGLQNLGFQFQDLAVQIGGGTSAIRAFAQQGPQMIGALQEMSGGTSKFAMFMGGPWGVALGVGAAVVGALAVKLLEGKDAADKSSKANETLAEKLDVLKHRYEDVTKAIEDYNKEQANARQLAVQQAGDIASSIGRDLEAAQKRQADLQKQLAEARKAGPAVSRFNPATGQVEVVKENFRAQEAIDALAKTRAEITALQTAARNAIGNVADEVSKLNTSPVEQITAGFKILRDQVKQSNLPLAEQTKRLDDLRKAEEAVKKAREDAARVGRENNTQFGREIDIAQARAIAQRAGFQVNSGTRSYADQKRLYDQWVAQGKPADNPVAVPGTSAHESGHALDIQFGTGVTVATIKKAFADEGVRLTKILTERGHFHIEFSTAGADRSNRQAEAAARAAQRAQDEQTRRAKEFADASASADKQLLAFKIANTTDAGQLAQFARDEIKVESDKYNADILAKEKLGDLTKAQGDELIIKNAILSALKDQKTRQDEAKRLADQAYAIDKAANDNQKEILGLQEKFAVTQDERRKIQLSILAIEKDEERKALKRQSKDPDPNVSGPANIALGSIDQRYGLKQQDVIQGTEGPLDRYIRENDPKLIQEKVEALTVNELESVRNGIDDAISNALGVKDPFLKGIIDLFIQTVLINPIAQALQKAQASSGGGGGFGGILGSIGRMFGGGGGGGGGGGFDFSGVSADLSPSSMLDFAFASGGYVSGKGSGTSDSIHARLSNGEYVLNAKAVQALGVGNLNMLNSGSAPRFAMGGPVGKMPALAARNDNRGGDTYHIHVSGGGTERENRQTGAQIYRGIREAQANQRRIGA